MSLSLRNNTDKVIEAWKATIVLMDPFGGTIVKSAYRSDRAYPADSGCSLSARTQGLVMARRTT
jgi:C4-type Zn-finger protein